MRRWAKIGKPHHDFIRGLAVIQRACFVGVQEHINCYVGVDVVLEELSLVGFGDRLVPHAVGPLEGDADAFYVADQDGENAINLNIRESVDGLRFGALGVLPCDGEFGSCCGGGIGAVVE